MARRSTAHLALSGLAAGLVLWICGCEAYRPMPLTRESVARALAAPDPAEIRARARSLRHPVLAPVAFDARDGLSADEAAILAVLANPSLRALRDRREVAATRVAQAGSLPDPRISSTLESPVGGGTAGTVAGLGFGLDWDVTSLLTRRARVDAAAARAEAVDLEVAWREWRVAETARLLLCRLRLATERREVAGRWSGIARERSEAVQRGVKAGLLALPAWSAARDGVRDAETALLDAEAVRTGILLSLDRVLGLPAGTPVTPEEGTVLPFLGEPPPEAELVRDLERRRLDLLALARGYESQEAKVRAAVASQFPRIEIGPVAGRDTDGVVTAGSAVTVTLPLFDRGRSRIAIQRATRRGLFDEYVARLFEARSEVSRLLQDLRAVRRRLRLIESSVGARRDLADRYRAAAARGTADILQSLEAEAGVQRLRLDRLDLAGRAVDLAVALEIASGRTVFSTSPRAVVCR